MAWLRRALPWLFALVVTLSWDASPTTTVTGYNVYAGPEGSELVQVIDVGNILTAEVPGTEPRCFAVTAYDDNGNESEFSNVVCSSLPGQIEGFEYFIR